jgi:hypothetical protein
MADLPIARKRVTCGLPKDKKYADERLQQLKK